jgi:hypothetical protein
VELCRLDIISKIKFLKCSITATGCQSNRKSYEKNWIKAPFPVMRLRAFIIYEAKDNFSYYVGFGWCGINKVNLDPVPYFYELKEVFLKYARTGYIKKPL